MRTTSARGYGWRHQKVRKALLPKAIGQPCARCGEEILPRQPVDLDHSDDRKGYLGFSHASCNRARRPEADPAPKPRTAW